jgi:hypothetical protein
LASRPHNGRDSDRDAAAGVVAATVLSDIAGVDRAAAALYGPPDRKPQATQEALLEAGKFDGGRGQARAYLEETAASRFLAP